MDFNELVNFLNEKINDLSTYEEVYDKDNKLQIINPYKIVKDILLSYDDISDLNGPYVELLTQSGSKHIIKVNTVNKILKLGEDTDKNKKVSIKDNEGNKIYTSLNKIKEINLVDNDSILLCFNDINGDSCYFKKKDILKQVNEIVINNLNNEYISLKDINGNKKNILYSQIKIINHKIRKNLNYNNI